MNDKGQHWKPHRIYSRQPIILRSRAHTLHLESALLSAPSRPISRISKLSSTKRYDHEHLMDWHYRYTRYISVRRIEES